MATIDPRGQPQTPQTNADEHNRSENLLPGEEGAEDGRFEVAEEVAFDIQGDDARRVGQLQDDENKGTP